ncbi:MAG TPA: AAC(3) family N-acetyltransferase [Magnetospirillaceae bacterium]|jgi:aminoglycoside 3-N-acetyltransferase
MNAPVQNLTLRDLGDRLDRMIGTRPNPVVIYTAVWPLGRALGLGGKETLDGVLGTVLDVVGSRSLAMPAFTHGFRDGFCNLDAEPSITGMLSEAFRLRPGVRRTVSAFFSFAVQGPQADAMVALRPQRAWGEGSLYEWFEQQDATFVLLGAHPTHCSYLHRMEWLIADKIAYRYPKSFHGRVRHEGNDIGVSEELFVRSLQPVAKNDFTVLTPILVAGGMASEPFGGAPLSVMSARAMRDAFLPRLHADPFLVLSNRKDFERGDA